MPLHDWSKVPEWQGVHLLWIAELFRDIKSKLPSGYRAGLGSVASLSVGGPTTYPDVSVGRAPKSTPPSADETGPSEDSEFEHEVTLLSVHPTKFVRVYRGHELVAVLELISPGNKDRASTRQSGVDRLVGYLSMGIQVVFIDVHAQPLSFSLADEVARALEYPQVPSRAPIAMSYRVGNASDGFSMSMATRRVPLTIGEPLPPLPLSLTPTENIVLDLETTYSKATNDYLSWLPSLNGAE